MSLFVVQLSALFLLLLGTFISGSLPIFCFRFCKFFSCGSGDSHGSTNKVTSFLIYFGGGVLMSTSLIHLLPEAREAFQKPDQHGNVYAQRSATETKDHTREGDAQQIAGTLRYGPNSDNDGHNESFAVPEFIVLCGFFMTYLIEEVIHFLVLRYFRGPPGLDQEVRARFCTCAQRDTECSRFYKDVRPDSRIFSEENKKEEHLNPGQEHAVQQRVEPQGDPLPGLLQSSIISQAYPNYGAVAITGPSPQSPIDEGPIVGISVSPPPQETMPDIVVNPVTLSTIRSSISLTSLLTVAALSFHSIFEGFTIGFQQSTIGTWTLFLAVALHKFVISFVISVEVLADGGRVGLVLAYMAVFSIMSPLGMTIAMSMENSVKHMSGLVVGTVNCLATGTLLYVTFFEILQRKSKGVYGLQRFIATAAGAGIMAGLQYIATAL